MQIKTQVMDENALNRAIARIAHEISERNDGVDDVCILGVKRRGVPFAERIKNCIMQFEGVEVPFGALDVTMNRDDYSEEKKRSLSTGSFVPFSITDKTVIIADDVLFTGRTAKAAIETIFEYGRPKCVQLVTLIDRGHRELPIRPDYVGKNVPSSKDETVAVRLSEIDGETGVYICE